jgi:uncharacterized phage protein (TIGR01671 family)
MSEHKFRGKRCDNEEWIVGDGIYYPKSVKYIGTCWIDGMKERVNDWIQIDPETVGDFTELPDKNGKEIFEGDIVRVFRGATSDIGVVKYDERVASFAVIYTNGGCNLFLDIFQSRLKDPSVNVEIIGNRWDNPELLTNT